MGEKGGGYYNIDADRRSEGARERGDENNIRMHCFSLPLVVNRVVLSYQYTTVPFARYTEMRL
jgi:hypothetical protein